MFDPNTVCFRPKPSLGFGPKRSQMGPVFRCSPNRATLSRPSLTSERCTAGSIQSFGFSFRTSTRKPAATSWGFSWSFDVLLFCFEFFLVFVGFPGGSVLWGSVFGHCAGQRLIWVLLQMSWVGHGWSVLQEPYSTKYVFGQQSELSTPCEPYHSPQLYSTKPFYLLTFLCLKYG